MNPMGGALINPNPVLKKVDHSNDNSLGVTTLDMLADDVRDPIGVEEVFDALRNLRDPEHPHTLEELAVVNKEDIEVDDEGNRVHVVFTPTIPHCSMATLIGLCIRSKLLTTLPPRFKVDVHIAEGSHVSEQELNKQLNDKERVAAALENLKLSEVVQNCIADTDNVDFDPPIIDLQFA